MGVPARAAVPALLGDRAPLKNPVLLVHGATTKGSKLQIGFLNFGEYFNKVPELYRQANADVRVAELTTDSSIGERAAVLKNYIETELKGRSVNIVAHSLGGLDARYLVSVLGAPQVVSITTIGTPHLGTPLADWAVDQVQKKGIWYWLFRVLGYDMAQRRFLPEITTYGMQTFNERVFNLADLRYYSVVTHASFSDWTMSFLLWFPARWLEGRRHPMNASGHDGLVPVASQTWGKEVYRGQLDHLAQMNHHEWRFSDMQQESLKMYVNIYDNLAKEGL